MNAAKAPRRVGLKRDNGHPAYLYFKLVEKGKNIRLSRLPGTHNHVTFTK